MTNKTALIIGATGLTGEECLKQLLETSSYSQVIALTRKPISIANARLQNVVVNFDNLDKYANNIKADHIYCAIGTTIGKAGSKKAFRHVDFGIPLRVAQMAKANGAEKLMLVSSMSANANSPIFYSRTKGELEDALKAVGFQSLNIFRPSLLLGDRKEKRTGEEVAGFVMEKFSFLFNGALKKYKGTPVTLLAKAMIKAGLESAPGVHIIENEEILISGEK